MLTNKPEAKRPTSFLGWDKGREPLLKILKLTVESILNGESEYPNFGYVSGGFTKSSHYQYLVVREAQGVRVSIYTSHEGWGPDDNVARSLIYTGVVDSIDQLQDIKVWVDHWYNQALELSELYRPITIQMQLKHNIERLSKEIWKSRGEGNILIGFNREGEPGIIEGSEQVSEYRFGHLILIQMGLNSKATYAFNPSGLRVVTEVTRPNGPQGVKELLERIK